MKQMALYVNDIKGEGEGGNGGGGKGGGGGGEKKKKEKKMEPEISGRANPQGLGCGERIVS